VADTTAPVVNITNPVNGATISGNVNIGASATDNVAIANVSLYVDGVLKATGNGSVTYTWNARKEASGTHTIQATARDTAGNSTTKTVQVVK
ncbi:peptidase S8, partial [Pseudoduganella sp. DS3]